MNDEIFGIEQQLKNGIDMEVLGENLISYAKVIDFLKEKNRDKNFFDTLRTRHKLIHKPIIKPPIIYTIKGIGKIRRGRAVFYLKEILPFLTKIIRLHDEKHLTFKQIEEKMRGSKLKLDTLRRFEISDDNRLKPEGFIDLFEIAKIKLKNYMKWTDEDIKYLHYISSERQTLGKKYYELTKVLRDAAKKETRTIDKDAEVKRESLGERLDFCHHIMEGVINHMLQLKNKGKIKVTVADLKKAYKQEHG
jgi:hypothetical protein